MGSPKGSPSVPPPARGKAGAAPATGCATSADAMRLAPVAGESHDPSPWGLRDRPDLSTSSGFARAATTSRPGRPAPPVAALRWSDMFDKHRPRLRGQSLESASEKLPPPRASPGSRKRSWPAAFLEHGVEGLTNRHRGRPPPRQRHALEERRLRPLEPRRLDVRVEGRRRPVVGRDVVDARDELGGPGGRPGTPAAGRARPRTQPAGSGARPGPPSTASPAAASGAVGRRRCGARPVFRRPIEPDAKPIPFSRQKARARPGRRQ